MRVCFLAEKLCALNVNGIYLGRVDGFERYAELDPKDGAICSLAPVGGVPLLFYFDDAFLLSPPAGISLYYTESGVAVYASGFLRSDPSLHVLWQERIGGVLYTLVVQGKLQLYCEGADPVDLPDALETAKPEPCRDGVLLRAERAFAVLSPAGKLLLLSEGNVLENGETLKAEVPFHDSLGHSAVCEWRAGSLQACSIRTAREPNGTTYALALFESVLIGADVRPLLSEELRERADRLKDYLGDYRSVVLTDRPGKVGLVYPRRERVYDVRYFEAELGQDGKISNLRPL